MSSLAACLSRRDARPPCVHHSEKFSITTQRYLCRYVCMFIYVYVYSAGVLADLMRSPHAQLLKQPGETL